MIVNPDVMDTYSLLAEKRKCPEKRKKHNLLKSKRRLNNKLSAKGGPVFTFNLPGSLPWSPVSYATGDTT